MSQELFTIKPQDYFNTKGQKVDTFEIVLIRLVRYRFFGRHIEAYVEKQNIKGIKLGDGFNVSIPTPDTWAGDDMDAVKAIAATPQVDCEVLGIYTPPVIDPITSQPTV